MDLSALIPLVNNFLPNNSTKNDFNQQKINLEQTKVLNANLGYPETFLDFSKNENTNQNDVKTNPPNNNIEKSPIENILGSLNNNSLQGLLNNLNNGNLNTIQNLLSNFNSKSNKNSANSIFSMLNNTNQKNEKNKQTRRIKDFKNVDEYEF